MPIAFDDAAHHSLADFFLSYLSSSLQGLLPGPLFQLLARFSNLAWRLLAGVSNDPSSWTSTLLPPLVAIFAAYLSLVMAYRTLRSTVLLVWWGIKWGAIIGAAIAVWTWWTGYQEVARSVGEMPIRGSGLASWLGGMVGGDGATLATALPLLSSLYGAAAQRPTTQVPHVSRRRGSNAGSQQKTRGRRSQSTFDPLHDDELFTGAMAPETLLRSAIDKAGSLFRPAVSLDKKRANVRQQRPRDTAQRLADLLGSANSGRRRSATPAAAGGASSDQEGQFEDVLSTLLSNVGMERLVDVAQGVNEEGDQSQMRRWMNMLRDTFTEETQGQGPPARSRKKQTSRSQGRDSWLFSREGSAEMDDDEDDGDDDDEAFVWNHEEGDEGDHAWTWPWSAASQRARDGPAANTRSSKREGGRRWKG